MRNPMIDAAPLTADDALGLFSVDGKELMSPDTDGKELMSLDTDGKELMSLDTDGRSLLAV